ASPENIPLISFIIIDQNEVFTRAPVKRGSEDEYIVIRNQKVVELFKKYYEDLFQGGRSLKDENYERLKDDFMKIHQMQ
ncbi:MAG: hypothetical protein AAFV90_25435, partial [Cyanobacteria bacterium J06634_5]